MKILIVDTYYKAFLDHLYKGNTNLSGKNYDDQLKTLLATRFGTSDYYSYHLRNLGCDADDLIVNSIQLQTKWLQEANLSMSTLAMRVPPKLHRVPILGRLLSSMPGLVDIAIEQIKREKPDVLYCQDLSFFPPSAIEKIRPFVKLIVGQIACPLPPNSFLKNHDVILTSFPHFVAKIEALGIKSRYFKIAFDERILSEVKYAEQDIPVSFVGGISRHHRQAIPLLEHLAETTPIEFFGYGADNLPKTSPIKAKHKGPVWGHDMYRTLGRSKMTINRHINVAENNANNMRLFEATGMGTLLITDRKNNLSDLFEIDKEIVTYSSEEEATELINYYLKHPDEANTIAKAGQQRTLEEHSYAKRMQQLVHMLRSML